MTLDRLKNRRRLVEQFDDQFRKMESNPDLGSFPREQRLAFDMLTSSRVREAFDLNAESTIDTGKIWSHAFRFGDTAGPSACRARRAIRQRELGQLLQAV